jgi:hypothetical protein
MHLASMSLQRGARKGKEERTDDEHRSSLSLFPLCRELKHLLIIDCLHSPASSSNEWRRRKNHSLPFPPFPPFRSPRPRSGSFASNRLDSVSPRPSSRPPATRDPLRRTLLVSTPPHEVDVGGETASRIRRKGQRRNVTVVYEESCYLA